MGFIVDISHHQNPANINYPTFCSQLDMAIIRVQYGSKTIDRHYKKHIAKMQEHGIPYGVYAWVRGVSLSDMEKEAQDFFDRSKDQAPLFYVLDVEEKSMADMRAGISAYVKKLRSLTDKKIGIYIAHHYYKPFNLNLSEVDFVWIPRYGANNGKVHGQPPDFNCDLWQYTSKGRLIGYGHDLDLNQPMNGRTVDFFTDEKTVSAGKENDKTIVALQTVIGAKPDGIPGKETLSKCPTLRRGQRSDVVAWLQSKLGIKADGIFGINTLNAIFKFQSENDLVVDGIFGQKSWKKMLGL